MKCSKIKTYKELETVIAHNNFSKRDYEELDNLSQMLYYFDSINNGFEGGNDIEIRDYEEIFTLPTEVHTFAYRFCKKRLKEILKQVNDLIAAIEVKEKN